MNNLKNKTQDIKLDEKDIMVFILNLFFGLTFAGLLPPHVVKKKGKFIGFDDVTLYELGKAIGLDSPNIQARLKSHNKALWLHTGIFTSVFIGIFILAMQLFIHLVDTISFIIAILLYFPYFYLIVGISFRLVAKTANRFFAESLCISASLRLVFLLKYNDVLEDREKKQQLLVLIDFISTHLLLFPYSYDTQRPSSEIKEQFRKISKWLDAYRIEVVFPTETTLERLRQELYFFTQNISSGYLGNLKILDGTNESKGDLSTSYSSVKKIIRFFGFVIPLFIIGIFLWQPNLVPAFHVNTDHLVMAFLLWFLLGIDIYFELGIVSRIINLVRSIRDL